MFIFKITLMFVGIAFFGFGYFIFFKGKYNLINNFEEDKKKQIYDNSYARRVGKIVFTGGLIIFILGVVSLLLSDIITVIIFTISIVSIIVVLIVNMSLSKKISKSKLKVKA